MSELIKDAGTFKDLAAAGRSVVILFYSGWCPFCSAFLPVFEKHAASAPANFRRVLTDDLPDLEDKYSVEVVPTVILIKGGKAAKRLDGALAVGLTESRLVEFLKDCGLCA